MFYIEFFETENGTKPALDFIRNISDPKLKAKVYRSLKLLESYGNQLGEPDTKSLGDGLFELRTKHSSNIVRNLYFYHKGRIIVVTNGFIKKSGKTPPEEMRIARERKRKYEEKNK